MDNDYMSTLATLRMGAIALRDASSGQARAASVNLTVKALGLGPEDAPTIRRLLERKAGEVA